MTEIHPFIAATKAKLRFAINGHIAIEDLWDLPLSKLDEMAVAIDSELSKTRKSFLENPDRKAAATQEEDALRLEVLKLVIETKQNENKAKREASAKRARREFLERIREKREIDQLESLSIEDIDRELAALDE